MDALPNRFNALSISNLDGEDIKEVLSIFCCPYILTDYKSRKNNYAVFAAYDWMIEATREPVKEMFDLSDEYIDSLSFHDFWKVTDSAVCLDYEGYPVHETFFSDDQW